MKEIRQIKVNDVDKSLNRSLFKSKRFLGIIFCLVLVQNTHAQQLQMFIEEAWKNNPEIQQLTLSHDIANERVNEANTLPDTQVSLGYFISEPETRTGPQRFKVSVKQMVPWFGTITARENYLNSLAETAYEDIVIAKRKLSMAVAHAYYNLSTLKRKEAVYIEHIALLKQYETIALTYVETGKASAVDVLKLQIRQNELLQQNSILNQKYLAELTHFNLLLNRDKNTSITNIDSLQIPIEAENVSKENLVLHPELLKYDKMYASVTEAQLVNDKDKSPFLGFGLDYINVSERTDMNVQDNGKDIFMPMVTLSIPIFNNKIKSKTIQNQLQQEQIIAVKDDKLNKLTRLLETAIYDRSIARISYETESENLVNAKNAEQILIKNYETGTINFNDVLDIQELQLKFQLKQVEATKNYYIQSSIINYLTRS